MNIVQKMLFKYLAYSLVLFCIFLYVVGCGHNMETTSENEFTKSSNDLVENLNSSKEEIRQIVHAVSLCLYEKETTETNQQIERIHDRLVEQLKSESRKIYQRLQALEIKVEQLQSKAQQFFMKRDHNLTVNKTIQGLTLFREELHDFFSKEAELRKQEYINLKAAISELSNDINKNFEQKQEYSNPKTTTRDGDSDISCYIGILALLTGLVIGLVGAVFGIGAVLVIRGNKQIIELSNKRLEIYQKELETSVREQKQKCENDLRQLRISHDSAMQELTYYLALKFLIRQPNPDPDDVYWLLAPLAAKPQKMYEALFNNIVDMAISSDITEKAEQGLSRLKSEDESA